jgi:hypothetical protein
MFSKVARWTFADSKNNLYFQVLMPFAVALILGKWSWWIPMTYVASLTLSIIVGQIWFLEEIKKEVLGRPRPSLKAFFRISKVEKICYLSALLLTTPAIIIFHLSPFQVCLIIWGYMIHFLMIHHNFFEKKPEASTWAMIEN